MTAQQDWDKYRLNAMRKIGILRRPGSASLGDAPETPSKGQKKQVLSPTDERIVKKGKGNTSPSFSEASKSQTPEEDAEWRLVKKEDE